MTKPDPVCGALTHKKTPCQNTLVTGCGLCPVHASQLRAANGAFKQKAKGRRKKGPTTVLQPDKLPSTPISLQPPIPHPATLLPDQFLYNVTPVQQPQPDFYQPEVHALKNDEVLDILKTDALTLVSPVTPRAPDSRLKGDLFPEEGLREECSISSHSPSENHLQTAQDSYLLEVDLPMDLPMPKFD